MRWKRRIKNKNTPNKGDIRIIKKFLFLPLEIDNKIRWLWFYKIKQKYYYFPLEKTTGPFGGPLFYGGYGKWIDKEWVE